MTRDTRVMEMRVNGWDFLLPVEVATLARISVPTVYRHIEEGRLKAQKVGGNWRIKRIDAEEYLGGHLSLSP